MTGDATASHSFALPVDDHNRASELKITRVDRPHMRAFHFAWFSFFLAFTGWFALAPLTPLVRVSLGLCDNGGWEDFNNEKDCECGEHCETSLANAHIASIAGTIGMRLAIGPLAEMYGSRAAQAGLMLVFSIPLALGAFVTDIGAMARVRFFIGGMGATFVVTQFWTSEMFSSSVVGTANATAAGWGNLGGGFTQVFMPFVVSLFAAGGLENDLAWRAALFVPATVLMATGVALYFLSDDVPEGRYRDLYLHGVKRTEGSCLVFLQGAMDVRVWVLALVYGGCFGTELTMNNVLALYFFDYFGLSTQEAGIAASIFGLMNLFCRSLGGIASDRAAKRWSHRGRHWVLFVTQLLVGVFLFLFSRVEKDYFWLALLMLIAFSTFVQMAEGAEYAIVPTVGRHLGALGPVSGIVAAGGNAGAVIWLFIYQMSAGGGDKRTPFMIHSFGIMLTALLIPLVHFSEFGSVLFPPGQLHESGLPNQVCLFGRPMTDTDTTVEVATNCADITSPVSSSKTDDIATHIDSNEDASRCVLSQASAGPGRHDDILEDPLVAKPELPVYGELSQAVREVRTSVRNFVDTNLASESAAFISYKPVTTAFRRTPFQLFVAFDAAHSVLLALVYLLDDDVFRTDTIFLNRTQELSEAGNCLLQPAIILLGILAARLERPAWMTRGFGLCHIINMGMCAVLSIECFVASSPRLGEFWLFFAVGSAIPIYALMVDESVWAEALLFRGVVHLIPPTMNFIETEALISVLLSVEGFLFLFITSITIVRRRLALDKAIKATIPDKERYDKVWVEVAKAQEQDLKALSQFAGAWPNVKRFQPLTRLDQLYPAGQHVNQWYQEVVSAWALRAGCRHHAGQVKSLNRTMEKVMRSYKGKVGVVLDIVRATIVTEHVAEVLQVLKIVVANSEVHVIKNRFDLGYVSSLTAGYRDVNVQLTFKELDGSPFEGFVFELQIHLRAILALKSEQGHKRYIDLRNLRGD